MTLAELPCLVGALLEAARGHDKHARTALRAYASSMKSEDPKQAQHIIHLLNDLPRTR